MGYFISKQDIISLGNGAYGRLGVGSTESVTMPTLLRSIKHIVITKVAVHSSGKHCLALSQEAEV